MANDKQAAVAADAATRTHNEPDALRDVPEPKLDWMGSTSQWHTRALPGEHGLRLGDINIGIYGEVPEYWPDRTRRPRGATRRPGVPPLPYNLRHKHELWADCAADLYEEAIQRRWIPATDVPWDTLAPLPEDVERSVCQVLTELSQCANVELETIAAWQDQMSYGYHEVKQYLATATFDCARHMEALRKRMLSNGGGIGLESRGFMNRMVLESRGGWTEAVLYMYLLRGTFLMTVYRYLLNYAHNDAERTIYGYMIQDHARHMAYGLDHLRYAVAHTDDGARICTTLLNIGEMTMVRELKEPVLRSALAIIFAEGVKDAASTGGQVWYALVDDFLREYLAHCDWIGINRDQLLVPMLRAYLSEDPSEVHG